MPFDVFISHSLKDKATADAVCARLEEEKVRCWIAPRDIRPGADWAESIISALGSCKVMVLIFSSHSNNSPQVKREVQRAFEKGLTVMPFRIEDVQPNAGLEYYIGSVHWLDALNDPMERHIEKLAVMVSAFVVAAREADKEEQDRLEVGRKAKEENDRLEVERKAKEEQDRLQAERKAGEERDRLEAERRAREEREPKPEAPPQAVSPIPPVPDAPGETETVTTEPVEPARVEVTAPDFQPAQAAAVEQSGGGRGYASSAGAAKEGAKYKGMIALAFLLPLAAIVWWFVFARQEREAGHPPPAAASDKQNEAQVAETKPQGTAVDDVQQTPAADTKATPAASNANEDAEQQRRAEVKKYYNEGNRYSFGDGIELNNAKAAEFYKKAADLGDADTQLLMGTIYSEGKGVPQDYMKAMEYFQKAADQGSALAQLSIALLYENGQGVEIDHVKADEYLQKAADLGNVLAEDELGMNYTNGTGVEKNYAKALELLQKSADKGYSEGEADLGMLYSNGWGVERSYTKAAGYYQKAADQGSALGQSMLGWLYENGWGVEKNIGHARELYEKADAHHGTDIGSMFAKASLERLKKTGQ